MAAYDEVIRRLEITICYRKELNEFEARNSTESIPPLKENETRIT